MPTGKQQRRRLKLSDLFGYFRMESAERAHFVVPNLLPGVVEITFYPDSHGFAFDEIVFASGSGA